VTDLRPFRALRYDPAQVELEQVLAPVYDVVAPEERGVFYDRHPHNALRLDMLRDAAEEADTDYAESARRLAQWRSAGILRLDDQPGLYVLRQQSRDEEGRALSRTGFFASLGLADYAERMVRPHERTMAGPRADRLKLLRATRANLSSVFLLYADRALQLDALLDAALAAPGATRVRDAAGVWNEFAPLRDAQAIGQVQRFFAERPVVIADGHHRYETALAYRSECAAQGVLPGSARILAYFANAFGAGSRLLPIHRLVRRGPRPGAAEWESLAAQGWRMAEAPLGALQKLPALLRRHLAPLGEKGHAFAADMGDGRLLLFSRPANGELAVRAIHQEVLGGVFGLGDAELRGGAVAFPKSAVEAARALRAGEGVCALYLNATPADAVLKVAEAGETMPQKSTLFAPKLATGLLFRCLETPE